jgi:hypothetical protein
MAWSRGDLGVVPPLPRRRESGVAIGLMDPSAALAQLTPC